jgi:hypothetical protein
VAMKIDLPALTRRRNHLERGIMSIKGRETTSAPLLKNASAAPVIYFDNIPVYGAFAGHIEVEIAARVLMPRADGKTVSTDMVCVAHLRCSPQAAAILADALQKGLAMLAKQNEQPSSLQRALAEMDDEEKLRELNS